MNHKIGRAMVENWIDVNKYGDGTDDYLCWGAALANALSFTGLVKMEAYDIYNIIRSDSNRERHWIWDSIENFFLFELGKTPPLNCFKILPPSMIWVLNGMEALGGCAILAISDRNRENGHALTAYETVRDIGFSSDDPRSVKQLICADSDDRQTVLHQIDVEYNIQTKKIKMDYYGEFFLTHAVLVLPPI